MKTIRTGNIQLSTSGSRKRILPPRQHKKLNSTIMYVRFFRWASDRVEEDAIITFVSNNSFVEARGFDGFRRCLVAEFNEIRMIDLRGNARTSGERRRKEAGNIFSDQIRVGVAIWFCVRKKNSKGCRILYESVKDYAKSEEKRDFLTATHLSDRKFREIHPDEDHNWIDLLETDSAGLLPVASNLTKRAGRATEERAIFRLFSLGVVTARDEWVYDEVEEHLKTKVSFLIDHCNSEVKRFRHLQNAKNIADYLNYTIKWTRAL